MFISWFIIRTCLVLFGFVTVWLAIEVATRVVESRKAKALQEQVLADLYVKSKEQ